MSRIAVAGATGSMGRTFIEALSTTDHTVFALSRADQKSSHKNITYHKVDYTSIDALTTFLQIHNIDTVISAISMLSPTNSQAQLNLISAAESSTTVTRFIPSEYGVPANSRTAAIDPYAQFWIDSALALEKTNLKYTRISVGTLFDWWGKPHLKTEIIDFPWVLDMVNHRAAIPGTGKEVVSMTYSGDLALFVVRLLDEEKWDVESAVVGQDISFDELVKVAEEATGRKFVVTFDDREMLERGEVTVLSEDEETKKALKEVLNLFGKLVVEGLLELPQHEGYRLNDRFPDMEVLTVEKMIMDCWGQK